MCVWVYVLLVAWLSGCCVLLHQSVGIDLDDTCKHFARTGRAHRVLYCLWASVFAVLKYGTPEEVVSYIREMLLDLRIAANIQYKLNAEQNAEVGVRP